jgi:hypothetical protein
VVHGSHVPDLPAKGRPLAEVVVERHSGDRESFTVWAVLCRPRLATATFLTGGPGRPADPGQGALTEVGNGTPAGVCTLKGRVLNMMLAVSV